MNHYYVLPMITLPSFYLDGVCLKKKLNTEDKQSVLAMDVTVHWSICSFFGIDTQCRIMLHILLQSHCIIINERANKPSYV